MKCQSWNANGWLTLYQVGVSCQVVSSTLCLCGLPHIIISSGDSPHITINPTLYQGWGEVLTLYQRGGETPHFVPKWGEVPSGLVNFARLVFVGFTTLWFTTLLSPLFVHGGCKVFLSAQQCKTCVCVVGSSQSVPPHYCCYSYGCLTLYQEGVRCQEVSSTLQDSVGFTT